MHKVVFLFPFTNVSRETDNRIADEGAIAEALKVNTTVKVLDLSSERIC